MQMHRVRHPAQPRPRKGVGFFLVNQNSAMTKETKKSTITIDGNVYALDALSANARAQIVNLRVTDQEIARLQTQLAIAQTARATYARALSGEIAPAAASTTQVQTLPY